MTYLKFVLLYFLSLRFCTYIFAQVYPFICTYISTYLHMYTYIFPANGSYLRGSSSELRPGSSAAWSRREASRVSPAAAILRRPGRARSAGSYLKVQSRPQQCSSNRAPLKGFWELIQGRFRVDTCKNHMAVSILGGPG